MSASQIEGKGVIAFVKDIADGFKALNPLVLKKIHTSSYKDLFQQLNKQQRDLRAEPFPAKDIVKIRKRNICLQRLHTATMILQHYAKEKEIPLL